jgi:NAD(P)H dehydrogenase (quinone)
LINEQKVSPVTSISIVYHSGYGHTKRVAEHVLKGVASVDGITTHLIAIDAEGNVPDSAWETLASSDGIIFGSPTYMGMVSWQFKKFADASSKPWYSQLWKGKVAAGFTNSASINGDKLSTLHYLVTLAMQHAMLWTGTGLMPSNSKAAKRDDINYLASFAGLMTQSPSDASADEIPAGDLATAEVFGKNVATTVVARKA